MAFFGAAVAALEYQIQNVESELQQLQQRRAQEEENLRQAIATLNQLKIDLKLHEDAFTEKTNEQNKAKNDLEVQENELKTKQEQLHQMQRKHNQFMEKLANDQLSLEELIQKKQNLEGNLQTAQNDLVNLKSVQAQMKSQIEKFKESILKGERQADQLMHEAEQVSKELSLVNGNLIFLDQKFQRVLHSLQSNYEYKSSLQKVAPHLNNAINERRNQQNNVIFR
ncbi:hypothetical protein FGO68_gene16572 [Halteria grandinella]|uniref:Uncharacterized protein n=1 Tax=Halteria grandinella TaxID=5974 RepID=A0A8J8T461_HALGN|nr:hypothetical protein FGO68_gene16572 [Halteria grandinella]